MAIAANVNSQFRRDRLVISYAPHSIVDIEYPPLPAFRLAAQEIVPTGSTERMRWVEFLLRPEAMRSGPSVEQYIRRAYRRDGNEFDPSYAAIQSIYTESLNDYVRRDLGFESDLSYEILTSVWPWSYAGVGDNRYTNVADDLRETMQRVPSMRVFVASGYYDLATPYFATDYTFDHLMLREELHDNVEIEYYESGHMMYVHLPSLDKLSRDLKAFYARSLQD